MLQAPPPKKKINSKETGGGVKAVMGADLP